MNFTKLWSFRGGDWTRGFTVMKLMNLEMAIDFSVLYRGITCILNYHGSIRNTVVQHINGKIERCQDFLNIDQKYIFNENIFKKYLG